ncbi:MAG: DUF4184 family protein [Cyclobacteriaceae bacterium]|nr:DUF4184 family protein [Cyclobacteriaceae bacterium]
MPFTFAHPAIVLPFSKIRSSYISVSCLVVGSIIPDFEYFITMKATGRFSHSLPGAFAFDLPFALVVVLIFHGLVKKPLIDSLPSYLYSRLIDLREFNFIENFKKKYFRFILCLLVGIFSHIAWDSFTHSNSYFVDQFTVLTKPVTISYLPSWPLFRYLQHISTGIGVLVILYFFHHQPARLGKVNRIHLSYWIGVSVITLVAFGVRWAYEFEYFADIVASLISSLLLAITIISSIFTIRSTNTPK